MGGFSIPYLGVTAEHVQKMNGEITVQPKAELGPEGRRHNMIINIVMIALVGAAGFLFYKYQTCHNELKKVTGSGMTSQ